MTAAEFAATAAPSIGLSYSVVVPVYGNQATLAPLVERLHVMADALDGSLEVVFVVDGSPDGSLVLLRRLLPTTRFASQLIAHSRNFGSFAAIRTGVAAARGDVVGVMAADLQEPPELVTEFFRLLSAGEYDVAVGRRTGRADPALSSAMSRTFWWLYRRWINKDIPPGGVDVFACRRQVADLLVTLDERNSSLIGLLFWLGYRRVEVPYQRAPREDGKSGWSLRKKVRYLLDSVYSFTDLPIRVLTLAGAIGGVLTLAVSAVVLVARLTGVIRQSGYTPLMLVILLSTFTLLFGLGVVGSYVWRTFENSKGRPVAVPMSVERYAGVRRE